jgi:UDP:flavonoid glycosyltransferase YjiC (YdhE family)
MKRIAYFISSHGFGHAARAASVMEAIHAIDPSIGFEIYTATPSWFFQDHLDGFLNYHYLMTDLGLVQKTPFEEDLDETIAQLNQLLPYEATQIAAVSHEITDLNCRLAICDVAPMGLLIAKKAGIPSVLVENFTWDWIYEGYLERDKQIGSHIRYLRRVFNIADVHIQTEPVCNPKPVDFRAGPASRKTKSPKMNVLRKLGLSENSLLVLITTGGVPQEYKFTDKISTRHDIRFVIPCGRQTPQCRDNLIFLPHHSEFFHPDLVNAADTVIGKAGYSTIAEVYHAGVPFGYIPCANNREAAKLVTFIEDEMSGLPIRESEFQSGSWTDQLNRLLQMPRIERKVPNGADQIAGFILNYMTRSALT